MTPQLWTFNCSLEIKMSRRNSYTFATILIRIRVAYNQWTPYVPWGRCPISSFREESLVYPRIARVRARATGCKKKKKKKRKEKKRERGKKRQRMKRQKDTRHHYRGWRAYNGVPLNNWTSILRFSRILMEPAFSCPSLSPSLFCRSLSLPLRSPS